MSSSKHPLRDVWNETPDNNSSLRTSTRQKSGVRYSSNTSDYKADPSSIIDSFKKTNESDEPKRGLPQTILPGFGEKYADCGDPIPRFCADCGSTHEVGRTCYRSSCPRCAAGWARRQSTSVVSKLEALRRYKESKKDHYTGNKFHHMIVSPPDGYEMHTSNVLDRSFDLVKEVLGELGASTGVIFYHPYRGKNGDDRGQWKERLFNDRDWKNDVRDELEFSPHFHVIVLSEYMDGSHATRAIEEKTGWVVERITKGNTDVSIYDKYDLSRVASYCLSHTGLYDTEQTTRGQYRYFGKVSNFEATDRIEAEMDAAVRSVAPKTLDLPWSSMACQEDRDGREPQSALVASTAISHEDDEEDNGFGEGDDETPPDGKCAGRLLTINKAPNFLDDSEWVENAPHADELEDVWNEWKEQWKEWEERIDEPPP